MTWRAVVWAFALYTAVAIVITFPLVLNLSRAVPHDLGDPLLSTAILWWNAHTLPFTERWWNGFAFFPASGMLAFSDHRLGASLIASPIMWLGASDVVAYNLTLLVMSPLSALGAHVLGFTLTRRHDAAAVCGLAYGFNPYRIAHIEHLELLAAYGMPLALAALHRFKDTRKPMWIGLFALALLVQGLSTSYFVLFFCVLLALWMVWFVGWRDWRFAAGVAASGLAAGVALLPVILGYLRIHHDYAMTRTFSEVVEFSADVSSIAAASPLLSLWGWTSSLANPERQLFPGLAVSLIAISGAIVAMRRPAVEPSTSPAAVPPGGASATARVSAAFAGLACAAIGVAVSVRVAGPWAIGPLRVSADAFKPQSVALVFLTMSLAALPAVRRAFTRRSPLAFYLLACAFMFLCSLGPKPMFLGTQVFYEPPYAWLMHLPVFGSAIRAPARFAMPAILALSAAAAIAFARLTAGRSPTRRRVAVVLACCAIVADTWTAGLPMLALGSNWNPDQAAGVASVLELPLGAIEPDVAAMHRATLHGRSVVNGYSGFTPPHYSVLQRALSEGDETALDPITAMGPLLVAVDRRADRDLELRHMVERVRGAVETGLEGRWVFFRLPASQRRPNDQDAGTPGTLTSCDGHIPVTGVVGPPAGTDSRPLFDGDPETGWISRTEQHTGDTIVVTLAATARTCALSILLGNGPVVYPGAVGIDLSLDGEQWHNVFEGKTAGLAVAGALRDPQHSPMTFRWAATTARLIRIRLLTSHPIYPWAMREIVVSAAE